jgi:hypothetical protein
MLLLTLTSLALAAPQSASTATVGPFEVVCTAPECQVSYGGQVVLAEAWSYDEPSQMVAPLSLLGIDSAWLVHETGGDGCQAQYRALCLQDGAPTVSELFGNCNAITSAELDGGDVVLDFPRGGGITDKRTRTSVRIAPATCAVTGG